MKYADTKGSVPTIADCRKLVSDRIDDIFSFVAKERMLPSGDMSPDDCQRLDQAKADLTSILVTWLEMNDPEIFHGGIERGEDK